MCVHLLLTETRFAVTSAEQRGKRDCLRKYLTQKKKERPHKNVRSRYAGNKTVRKNHARKSSCVQQNCPTPMG